MFVPWQRRVFRPQEQGYLGAEQGNAVTALRGELVDSGGNPIEPYALAASSDGRLIALAPRPTVFGLQSIYLYDAANLKRLHAWDLSTYNLDGLCFDPAGTRLVATFVLPVLSVVLPGRLFRILKRRRR